MNIEVWNMIVAAAPAIAGVLAAVITAVMSIRKVVVAIAEFRQSTEVKDLCSKIDSLLEDNARLKKMVNKLTKEMRKVDIPEWLEGDK